MRYCGRLRRWYLSIKNCLYLRPMTAKQKLFCEEYLIDLNATRAYGAVYTTVKNERVAAANASKLLTNPNISDYVAQKMKERGERTAITADRVVKELAKVAFFDIRKIYKEDGSLMKPGEFDDESAGAVAGLESTEDIFTLVSTKKVRLTDKVKALEILGRHLGIFEKDNGQKTPTDGVFKVEVVGPKK